VKRSLVFTAYNRPQYFTPVMASWAAVRGFADWDPVVFLEPSPVQQEMTRIAAAAGAGVWANPHRRGVSDNPWYALDTAFTVGEGSDFAVLAEDDVLVSDDVLEYFSWAAQRFRREHILTVCAASFATTCPPDQEQDTVRSGQFCPLVWGTWADRWTAVLRDSWDHDYSSGTATQPQCGWDWNIGLRVMGDWQVIAPAASRSVHIGADGGAHCTPAHFPATVAPTFTAHRPAIGCYRAS
jgi:hypothetical protein